MYFKGAQRNIIDTVDDKTCITHNEVYTIIPIV